MRLGIDLDGVVADFNTGWMTLYNEHYGTHLHPDMVTTWDAMVPLTHFSSVDDFWDWARNDGGPGLFRNLPAFPGALETLGRLAGAHEIVILTTKPPWAIPETFAWIAEHEIPTREVHITEEKWRVECDVYLDDGPHNLVSLVSERPDRTVCRFVRPWNDPVIGARDIEDWHHFETLIEGRFC